MLYHKRGKQNGTSIQQIILSTIAEVGYLTLAEVAPSAVKRLGTTLGLKRKTDPRYDIPRGVRKLIEKKLLVSKQKNGRMVFALTKKGEELLSKLKYGGLELKKPKQWDKKWRVVIYDIKEERRQMRNELKDVLKHVGFIPVQKSVWVYPYPCEDLLVMLKADFRVGTEVLYLVVEKLENDGWIRHHFSLHS